MTRNTTLDDNVTGEATIEDQFESLGNRHSDVAGVIQELLLNGAQAQMPAGINPANRYIDGQTFVKPSIYSRLRFIRHRDGTTTIGTGDGGRGMSKKIVENELIDPGKSVSDQFFSRFESGGIAAICWAEKRVVESPLPLTPESTLPDNLDLDQIDPNLSCSVDEYRKDVYTNRDRSVRVYTRAANHDPVVMRGPIHTSKYAVGELSTETWREKAGEYELPSTGEPATGTIVEVSLPAATLQDTARDTDAQTLYPQVRDICNTLGSHAKFGPFISWLDPQFVVEFDDRQLGNGKHGFGIFELVERAPVFRRGYVDSTKNQYLRSEEVTNKSKSDHDMKALFHSGIVETELNGMAMYIDYTIGVPDRAATLEKYAHDENGQRLLTHHSTFPGSPLEAGASNRGGFLCANYIGVSFSTEVLPKSYHPEGNWYWESANLILKSPEEELPLQTDREGFTAELENAVGEAIKEDIGYALPDLPPKLKAELGAPVSGTPENTGLLATDKNKKAIAKELVKRYKKRWGVTMNDVYYEREFGPARCDIVVVLNDDEQVMVGAEATDSRMSHTQTDDLWKYSYATKEGWKVLDLYAIAYGRTDPLINAINNYLSDLMPVEAPKGYEFQVHYRDAVAFLEQEDEAPDGYDREKGIPPLK